MPAAGTPDWRGEAVRNGDNAPQHLKTPAAFPSPRVPDRAGESGSAAAPHSSMDRPAAAGCALHAHRLPPTPYPGCAVLTGCGPAAGGARSASGPEMVRSAVANEPNWPGTRSGRCAIGGGVAPARWRARSTGLPHTLPGASAGWPSPSPSSPSEAPARLRGRTAEGVPTVTAPAASTEGAASRPLAGLLAAVVGTWAGASTAHASAPPTFPRHAAPAS